MVITIWLRIEPYKENRAQANNELQPTVVWQKLNVTAFTISGIASLPSVLGENYENGSGPVYLLMIRQPITIINATRG